MTVTYAASYAAWPPGTDPDLLRRDVARAHEEFLSTGRPPRPVRDVVRDSWQRSLRGGVDPEADGPRSPGLGAAELRDFYILAWRDSADDNIGWPAVKVAEVEAGTVDPWVAMYGED